MIYVVRSMVSLTGSVSSLLSQQSTVMVSGYWACCLWLSDWNLYTVKPGSHIRKHRTADVRISCLIYCNKNKKNLLRSEEDRLGWLAGEATPRYRNLRIIKTLRTVRVLG